MCEKPTEWSNSALCALTRFPETALFPEFDLGLVACIRRRFDLRRIPGSRPLIKVGSLLDKLHSVLLPFILDSVKDLFGHNWGAFFKLVQPLLKSRTVKKLEPVEIA
jgi:hypothetical protein